MAPCIYQKINVRISYVLETSIPRNYTDNSSYPSFSKQDFTVQAFSLSDGITSVKLGEMFRSKVS